MSPQAKWRRSSKPPGWPWGVRGSVAAGALRLGGWLASEAFSLADIQWGVVLYRLRWLGLQPVLWQSESSITAYSDRLLPDPHSRGAW